MRTKTINRANLVKRIAITNVTNQEVSEVLEKTLGSIHFCHLSQIMAEAKAKKLI